MLTEVGHDMYNKYSDMTPNQLIADVANEGMGQWTTAVNASCQAAQDRNE